MGDAEIPSTKQSQAPKKVDIRLSVSISPVLPEWQGIGGRWSVVVRGYSGVSGWILVSAMRVEWGEMCEVGSTQKA